MAKTFLKQNNLVPVIVAIITSITSLGIGYWQFGGHKPTDQINIEKVQEIVNTQIDLKLAPTNVKVDNIIKALDEYKGNQEKTNEHLIEILKELNKKAIISSNEDVLKKVDQIKQLKAENKKVFEKYQIKQEKI
jgi:tartrate dehydratase alpha subunit/fumarate hydratase class I-like protein